MRRAAHRIAVGKIAQPQLDRVHAQIVRQLVHRAFDGERADGLAGAAHEGVGQHVEVDMVLHDVEAFAAVERPAGQAVLLVANAVRRLHRIAVMQQRLQLAILVGGERDPLLGPRPSTDQAVHP